MKNVVMANVIPMCLSVQVSALDQELIEVDPDTKEMLKLLVSLSVTGQNKYSFCGTYFHLTLLGLSG